MPDRPDSPRLGRRGRRLLREARVAPYISAHLERRASGDPRPYTCLAIAENRLMWDLLDEQVNQVRAVPASAVAYDDMRGSEALRAATADFLGGRLFDHPVDPESVVLSAGAGSILENLVWTLGDAGDAVLVPTPSYAGYWTDVETRTGLTVVPAHTRSEDDFALSPRTLDEAVGTTDASVAALLLTNPSNPEGRIRPPEEIIGAVDWARGRGIPVIMNEIYGLSIHGDTRFRSSADILDGFHDDVHVVWAASKDLSASGLRCGVLISQDAEVRRAMTELAYFSAVSGDTQHLLTNMLTDRAWSDRYLDELRRRLRSAYEATSGALHSHGIRTVPAEAGIFFLADLRPHLEAPTWEAEHRLWVELFEAGVNLTPGSSCRIVEPGFMRVCFASESVDDVVAALDLVGHTLAR